MGISIHKQSLYDIENNKRTIKDYELFCIAYVLEIDVNDLLKDIRKNSKNLSLKWIFEKRSCEISLLRNGVPMEKIQKWLGYSSIRTTERYD